MIAEDQSRKREMRLLKNREAARECRRKKKEYIKCLENRVAVLENQNKALIEELKSLKELYCQQKDNWTINYTLIGYKKKTNIFVWGFRPKYLIVPNFYLCYRCIKVYKINLKALVYYLISDIAVFKIKSLNFQLSSCAAISWTENFISSLCKHQLYISSL